MSERVPCRVSAELRQHQAEQNHPEPRERPDFTQGDDVAQVAPAELAGPIASLLLASDQILARMARGHRGHLELPAEVHDLLRAASQIERALFARWLDL